MRLALIVLLVCADLLVAASAAPAARVAPGFALRTAVRHAPHPTSFAFDRQRRLWFTSAVYGPDAAAGVWVVRGGRAVHVIRRLNTALGLLWHRGVLYVSHLVPYTFDGPFSGRVTAFSGWDGHRFARRRVVVDHIPVGLHTVDSLAAGPGGRLYLGVGSQTDHRRTGRRLSASVISFRPDGSGVRTEGRGLRNPYGLAFVPGTSTLLIADHGRDDLGPKRPPDEVNALDVRGPTIDFGWPGCYGRRIGACRGTRTAAAFIPPHSAPGDLAVARRFGRFGESAYLAEYGSSFSRAPNGGDVVRFAIHRRGRHVGLGRRQVVASGLGLRQPLALAHGPDGALWVGLFNANRILRIVAK